MDYFCEAAASSSLPLDIRLIIFEMVRDDSAPDELLSMRLVSRSWRATIDHLTYSLRPYIPAIYLIDDEITKVLRAQRIRPNLTSLNLSDVSFREMTEDTFRRLSVLTMLTELVACSTCRGFDLLTVLALFPCSQRMRSLQLEKSVSLGPAIRSFPRLQNLVFQPLDISEALVSIVPHLHSLTSLVLLSVRQTSPGAIAAALVSSSGTVHSLPSLLRFHISSDSWWLELNDEDVSALAKGFPSLRCLAIDCTNHPALIATHSLGALTSLTQISVPLEVLLAPEFRALTKLHRIIVNNRDSTETALPEELAKYLTGVTRLNVLNQAIWSATLERAQLSFPSLGQAHLSEPSACSPAITQLSSLHSLSAEKAAHEFLSLVAKMTQLAALNLNFSKHRIDCLSAVVNLEELTLFRPKSVEGLLSVISSCVKLRKVVVIETTPSASAIAAIPSCLPNLTHLDLTSCAINDSTISPLTALQHLRYLGIADTKVSGVGLSGAKFGYSLRTLSLSHRYARGTFMLTVDGAKVLTSFQRIRELELFHGSDLDLEVLRLLVTSVPYRKVSLMGLTTEIAQILLLCRTLKTVRLANPRFIIAAVRSILPEQIHVVAGS